ncbi:metallopeptidase family protein [Actinomyces bowdenii]|nr:metallopeptidase family protein [Actinomyces bowdenii]
MTLPPIEPPVPVPGMSEEDFERAVGDALDQIPPELADAMDNVVVLIHDEPDPDMLHPEDYDGQGRPTLLGLYDGTPLTERDEGWSMVLPDRILIFRGPLQRWCATREELVEQIMVTVIHEVAHHFGIDDERLHELGWA